MIAPGGGWVATDKQTNAVATATQAAETNRYHVITGISASFSLAAAGILLELKDGANVIAEFHVHNQFAKEFPAGIRATKGNAVSAVLAAGGVGANGAVNLEGYTQGPSAPR